MITEWIDKWMITNNEGVISLVSFNDLIVLYPKPFPFLNLAFLEDLALTLGNLNPKEFKTLLWVLSGQLHLQTFHWVYGVKFFLCIHHQRAWSPWKRNTRCSINDDYGFITTPFLPWLLENWEPKSTVRTIPHFIQVLVSEIFQSKQGSLLNFHPTFVLSNATTTCCRNS